jgi:hypothetical protein
VIGADEEHSLYVTDRLNEGSLFDDQENGLESGGKLFTRHLAQLVQSSSLDDDSILITAAFPPDDGIVVGRNGDYFDGNLLAFWKLSLGSEDERGHDRELNLLGFSQEMSDADIAELDPNDRKALSSHLPRVSVQLPEKVLVVRKSAQSKLKIIKV